jgi:hypothetical protein
MKLVDRCGTCGNADLELVLSLGTSPPTCNMYEVGKRGADTHYPLELLRCGFCTLVQLSCIVDPNEVFPPDYPYSSGNSKALHENFEDLASSVEVGLDDLVVDIGANDGTLLSKFEDCRTVAVEPTEQIRKIPFPCATYQAFFSEKLAHEIREEHGPAKVITACNVLAHVEDIADVMRGINHLLADDGMLVAENHDLDSVVGGQWDTVYHEHLRFFDPHSFSKLLLGYGLGARSWEEIPTHGGSFRMAAKRGRVKTDVSPREYDFDRLAANAREARRAIRAQATGGVYGIGATARATTIINYCGLDVEDIACVCEVSGSDKIGRYIPGTRIPVVDEACLFEDQPERALMFSWHLEHVITPKLRERGYQGTLIHPFVYA